MAAINRGDNTGAFGSNFLKIYLNNPNNLYIQKMVLQINNDLEKMFYDPKFPLKINLTGAETEMLEQVNQCRIALWDEKGRRRTAEGSFTFFVKENHIIEPDAPIDDYSEDEEDNAIHFDLDDPEFAVEFVINATPTRMSELEQDIILPTMDTIKSGRNIEIDYFEDHMVINAELDATVEWSEIEGKPTINGMPLEGDVQVIADVPNADWNATSGPEQILNKPNLADVATSGNYIDLIGKPHIPENVSELNNDLKFIDKTVSKLDNFYDKKQVDSLINETSYGPINERITNLENKENEDVERLQSVIDTKLDKVDYDISGKADLIYVNEELDKKLDADKIGRGRLSIYHNGNELGEFSANSQVNESVYIETPEKLSQLENDTDFVTRQDVDLNNFVQRDEYDTDKANFATLDDIGSGILTLKSNGKSIGSFNANTKSNKTLDITVPTKLTQLEQDIDYLLSEDLELVKTELQGLQSTVETIPNQLTDLQNQIDGKVDFEAGKTLIPEDELEKLVNLQEYDDTEVRGLIQENTNKIAEINVDGKVDKVVGMGLSTNDFTDLDKANLDNANEQIVTISGDMRDLNNRVVKNTNSIDKLGQDIRTVNTELLSEMDQRRLADNDLQSQIDGLTTRATVADIVADVHDLEEYDLSRLRVNDVICVIKDETKHDTTSYYRFDGNALMYVGSEGEYFTKADANSRFALQETTINGKKLDKNIVLTPEDISALPVDTVIGDGIVTVQRNGIEVGTFSLNQTENKAIDIIVPEGTLDLENNANFVDENKLFLYIGDVPEDNNLQDQVDVLKDLNEENLVEIESLKALITGEIGGLPTVALTGSYNDLSDKPEIPENVSQLVNDLNYVTLDEAEQMYIHPEDIPTKVSVFENDRGYLTTNAIGRGTAEFILGENVIGEWTANQFEDSQIVIPLETEVNNVENPVTSNAVLTALNTMDSTAVHKTGNELVEGVKTFKNIVIEDGTSITPDVTDNSTKIATTEFVKSLDYSTNTEVVHKTGDESITGVKTFSDVVLGNATGVTMIQTDNSKNLATTEFVKNLDYSVNSNTVHRTGDEVIQGDKDFNDTIDFNGIVNLSKFAHVPTPDETDITNNFTDLVVNIEFVNNKKAEIENTIQNEVSTLNSTINTKENNLNNTINSVKSDLEGKDTELQNNIDNTNILIGTTKTELQNSISSLSSTVSDNKTELTGLISTLEGKVNTNETDIENKLSTLSQTVTNNKTELQTNINTVDAKFSGYYLKTEVDALITTKNNEIAALQSLIEALTARVEALES